MTGFLSPAFLLGLLFATAYAALFHVWGGRNVRDLLLYWLSACVGFAIGQAIGQLTQVPLLQIGHLHVIEGTLGAFAALVIARAWSQSAYADRQDVR